MTAAGRDHAFMARALRLARRGLFTTDPNPRVGCIIVRDDEIVGEGWHARAGGPHAEVVALTAAAGSARGATAYVTLEPCCHHGRTPPCTEALLDAGIARVVMASHDPTPAVAGAGAAQLAAAGIGVDCGVLGAEARALNVGYLRRMESGRPHVRSKIAVSLDGRSALANGTSQWITGEAARADVQRLRARSSAIVTGAGTVAHDDPSLNVRAEELGEVLQPMRVIVDSGMRTPPDARTLGLPGDVTVFTVAGETPAHRPLEQAGARIEIVDALPSGRVDLTAMLIRLGELGINEVLVEAGSRLNGALLQAGLINELVVYMAGSILGRDARGMFDIPELTDMGARPEFELTATRRIGRDLRLIWQKRAD
ncbi:MAG: bifunctional diaminohydroxyphosphoribosylaminopyrimidine deaminase/5-amino-6-(5-phosphoribosylamino)uracil reductase RibD [Gammaproteobacteria bacterium]